MSREIKELLLSPTQFSRPGKPLDKVMGIVIHYLGKPEQNPQQARNYWESLKTQDDADKIPDISASAHYIVGFQGEILRAIPESEKAFHCGGAFYSTEAKVFFGGYCSPYSSPNRVTIGVELCHPDWTGKPTEPTRAGALELVRDLCTRYSLDPRRAVFRHFDITEKDCPRWYVAHVDEWARFVAEI
jgi:N-acetylmuramoyl-L-alanine amidase